MNLKNTTTTYIKSIFDGSIKDKEGKYSSSRLSSFVILGSVLTSTLLFIVIDLINAIEKWKANEVYIIPVEHIGIFSLILSHHLILLGLKNSGEKLTNKKEEDNDPKDIE